jgi:leucyl-tRNA synthetase
MRLKITLAQSLTATEIEAMILDLPEIQKWTEGVNPKKIIVVHGKIINIVL